MCVVCVVCVMCVVCVVCVVCMKIVLSSLLNTNSKCTSTHFNAFNTHYESTCSRIAHYAFVVPNNSGGTGRTCINKRRKD